MFVDDIFDHVERTLAARPYFPCVLLVHTDVRTLEIIGERLAARAGWPLFAVSRVLVGALSGAATNERSMVASTALNQPLAQLRPGPVICTDLALLFEPALALDPLTLLRQWSRRVPLVACWPGAYAEGSLAYAVPEHAHYRRWNATQLCNGCVMPIESNGR